MLCVCVLIVCVRVYVPTKTMDVMIMADVPAKVSLCICDSIHAYVPMCVYVYM